MRRDALLAAGFAAAVVAGSGRAGLGQHPSRPADVLGFALAAAAAGSLAWRRRAPLVPLVAAVGLTSAYLLAGYPYGPILLCVVWAMFEYARRHPLQQSALAGLVAALVLTAAVLPRLTGHLNLLAVGLLLWAGCWLVVPWSLGALVYVRRRAQARERENLVARAVLQERIRVSREVHDVAGHGFAVVAMQAGVALVVLDEQPGQAREALEAIRATSRAALSELRAVLDTMEDPTERAAPADIAALVERARAAGLRVRLDSVGTDGVARERLRLAYDVVRESLTNVLRHAGPAAATVTVELHDRDLVVTVADDGPGAAGFAPGRGIAGMCERVEAAGGSLEVMAADGFTVRARIPA